MMAPHKKEGMERAKKSTLDIIFELALLRAFCSAVIAGFGFVSPANGLIANLNSSHISAVTEAW